MCFNKVEGPKTLRRHTLVKNSITQITEDFIKKIGEIFKESEKLYETEEAYEENLELYEQLTGSLIMQNPDRAETISQNTAYLQRFVKGIGICKKDERANNGGCAEPHTINILKKIFLQKLDTNRCYRNLRFFFKLCVKSKARYKKAKNEWHVKQKTTCTTYWHNGRKSRTCQAAA